MSTKLGNIPFSPLDMAEAKVDEVRDAYTPLSEKIK